MVRLTSSDLVEFVVDRPVAERSLLLRNMLEVIEYCDHHRNDPLPTADDEKDAAFDAPGSVGRRRAAADDIDEWDAAFIKVENNELLFDIILAANYLDIKPLLDLGCKAVANMLKGKKAEELVLGWTAFHIQIREMFNIENDFTPEEEEQIRRENEWAADL
ncbi:hypothetical protein HDU84_006593 [Entophlyctis sp. JEL0112]|nr:hypothetical protein HDU84_006593 [Entophlyctis sp. JEL0112]